MLDYKMNFNNKKKKVYYIRSQEIRAYEIAKWCQVLLYKKHKIFKSYKELIKIAIMLQEDEKYEYYGDICNKVLDEEIY